MRMFADHCCWNDWIWAKVDAIGVTEAWVQNHFEKFQYDEFNGDKKYCISVSVLIFAYVATNVCKSDQQ